MQIIIKNANGEELLNHACIFTLGTLAILDDNQEDTTCHTFCSGHPDIHPSQQIGFMKNGLNDILEAYQDFFIPLGNVINREDEVLNLISQLRNLLDYKDK